jgi:CRP-like cAMP-binding protein
MSQSPGRQIEKANALLSSILADDDGALAPVIRSERPPQGQLLSSQTELADPMGRDVGCDVWFPVSAVIALSITDHQGRSAQTGVVGLEGCVGLEALYPQMPALADATVQIQGEMLVIPAAHLRSVAASRPAVQAILLRSLYDLSARSLLTIACNRLHSLEARCCCWLLTMRDRTGDDDLPLTQEALATILGSGRPRINSLLAALERDGLVRRYRGRIRLASRATLERRACECYRPLTFAPRVSTGA